MNAKQKQILAIMLGIEAGITIFFLLYTNPVLSAWIPGTQTPFVQKSEAAPIASIFPTIPPTIPPTTTVTPTEFVPPTDTPETLPTPTSTSLQVITGPSTENTLPASPSLLAQSFPESFAHTPAIWAHAQRPSPHEIVLFRYAFELSEPAQITELQIFADTRYEVWLDGQWIGRGPARFSCTLREYDVYPLTSLEPGRHVVAVLVQWAPNARRSESNTPLLQARIQNYTHEGPITLAQTGADWNIYATTAWQPDAGLVHAWELVGPMELLDLNQLPMYWMQMDYADFQWAKAVEVPSFANASRNPTRASRICSQLGIPLSFLPAYQPRSIPLLATDPVTPTLYEAGWLSPNRLLIQPDLSRKSGDFTFNVVQEGVFTVEALSLSPSASITNAFRLDNLPLTWYPAGDTRPDVWIGLGTVSPGLHTLVNLNVPTFPVFNVYTDGLQSNPVPVAQGAHAGYRTLLADLAPDPVVVQTLSGNGIQIRIDQTPSYIILELPRSMYGRLAGEVLGPPGTVIDIGWDEKLYQNTRPLPFPGRMHPNWSQVDSWILDGNYRELTTLDARSGRYILINIWGNGPVEFHNLRVIEERYPVTRRGEFTSSDARLNQIWQVGVDTTQLNMLDAYADPWRERGQWWGDAFIVDRTNRVVFGDTALLRRGLRYMGDGFQKGEPVGLAPNGHDNHMLDYGMLWVQALDSYTTLTEDYTLIAEVYPTLQAFMSHLQRKTSGGLLNVARAHWALSTYLDTLASYSRFGQSTAVNSMYYATLQSAANLAYVVSDSNAAEQWQTQAETVKTQINTLLYQADEGRYATTLISGRLYAPDPYAQAWPLVYGIVPDTEIPRVVTALQELLITEPQHSNVEVYGMNWVTEALARNGYIQEMLGLHEIYFGYMLDAGATTWWESFTTPERYYSTRSHGWGSSPTWMLTTYLLGGQWIGPDTWQVRPALEGVTSVSGSLPIGENELTIAWEAPTCALAEIEIRAPSHTEGNLIIPFANVTALTLNDTVIFQGGTALNQDVTVSSDSIHVILSKRPEYRVTVVRDCP